jgi:hypothetical protein
MSSDSRQEAADFAAEVRELFPERCGAPVDPDAHEAAIVVRALNDGSPRLQQRVIEHYGVERVSRIARNRADRLTNPAYRVWRERLALPPRDPGVAFVQGLWRK